MQSLDEAYRMLDAFISVGATHFDVTFLDIDGANRGFRREQSAGQLRNSLPKLLPGLTERQNSLIVRPHEGTAALIQLDDLGAEALDRVSDVAFLVLATSPGNHQAWIAVRLTSMSVASAVEKDFARRLRKGTGADASASGATRLAGTLNYKRKYEADFPTVSIRSVVTGRHATPEQLETLGLVAPPEPLKTLPFRLSFSGGRSLPDYQRCLAGAPMNADGTGPDRSKADYTFCKFAAQRGFTAEQIAAELPLVSEKARERIANRDPGYVTITAENGVKAAQQGRQRSRI